MDEGTLDLFGWQRNNEYTGSVCWLFWDRKANAFATMQALLDIEDFERLRHLKWHISRIGKNRKLRVVRIEQAKTVYLARELLGFPAGMVVDHRNRDSLDDRRRNLRACTVSENNLNREQNSSARSRFKGVAWSSRMNKWQVHAGRRGKKVLVGCFACEIEAARAYNTFARRSYGEFAYLNPV